MRPWGCVDTGFKLRPTMRSFQVLMISMSICIVHGWDLLLIVRTVLIEKNLIICGIFVHPTLAIRIAAVRARQSHVTHLRLKLVGVFLLRFLCLLPAQHAISCIMAILSAPCAQCVFLRKTLREAGLGQPKWISQQHTLRESRAAINKRSIIGKRRRDPFTKEDVEKPQGRSDCHAL